MIGLLRLFGASGGDDTSLPRRLRPVDISSDEPLALPSDPTDASLVVRVRAGDEAAFEQLYHAHFDPLWEFAYTFVRTSDVAKDVVQDVFLGVWLHRTQWSVASTVRGYLFGAVRNRALKVIRRDRIDEHATSRIAQNVALDETRDDPSVLAEGAEIDAAVGRLLEGLPERQRTAVELKWRYQLTWGEVGAAMGISKVAAWKLGVSAQRRLHELKARYQNE